jgi:hypothetical protein
VLGFNLYARISLTSGGGVGPSVRVVWRVFRDVRRPVLLGPLGAALLPMPRGVVHGGEGGGIDEPPDGATLLDGAQDVLCADDTASVRVVCDVPGALHRAQRAYN